MDFSSLGRGASLQNLIFVVLPESTPIFEVKVQKAAIFHLQYKEWTHYLYV